MPDAQSKTQSQQNQDEVKEELPDINPEIVDKAAAFERIREAPGIETLSDHERSEFVMQALGKDIKETGEALGLFTADEVPDLNELVEKGKGSLDKIGDAQTRAEMAYALDLLEAEMAFYVKFWQKDETVFLEYREKVMKHIETYDPELYSYVRSNPEVQGLISGTRAALSTESGTASQSRAAQGEITSTKQEALSAYEKLHAFIPTLEITRSHDIIYDTRTVREVITQNPDRFTEFGHDPATVLTSEKIKGIMEKLDITAKAQRAGSNEDENFKEAFALVLGLKTDGTAREEDPITKNRWSRVIEHAES